MFYPATDKETGFLRLFREKDRENTINTLLVTREMLVNKGF